MDAIEPDAVGVFAVGLVIRQRRVMAAGVPLLAVHRAGMATDAGVEIDDEAELLGARQRLRQSSHYDVPFLPALWHRNATGLVFSEERAARSGSCADRSPRLCPVRI